MNPRLYKFEKKRRFCPTNLIFSNSYIKHLTHAMDTASNSRQLFKIDSMKMKPHMLLVSYPLQGHIAPIMKLAHRLVYHGTEVTVVISEFMHSRIISGFIPQSNQDQVRLVAIPDGLEPEDDRRDVGKLGESMMKVMPFHLEQLIERTNHSCDDNEKFSCVIADVASNFAVAVAHKMGLKHVMFFPSSPGILAMITQVPKLIASKIIDSEGFETTDPEFKIGVSSYLPTATTRELVWNCPGNKLMQKHMFQYILSVLQNLKRSEWVLCNWFHDLDPSIKSLMPNMLSIGPLLANEQPVGHVHSEDLSCINWLNKHKQGSVIYVAFGTTAIFDQKQLYELALGLELTGRPFLWAVRSDLTGDIPTTFPDGFEERTKDLGKIVRWAPQEKVLAHHAVLCYLTHCGWNSSIEGIAMGVPLLCWPYMSDQFYNRICICDGWKVGLWLTPNEDGFISRNEIKQKVDELVCNDDVKVNSKKLKELAKSSIDDGGSSSENLRAFIKEMSY